MANHCAISAFAPDPEPVRAGDRSAVPTRAWDSLPALKGRVAASRPLIAGDDSEVAEIVLCARRDAERMHADARRETEALMASARERADGIRQDAFVEGYASGLTSARVEVAAELGAEFDKRRDALRITLESVIEKIIAERTAMWLAMEGEITTVALEIARKIIKTEVEQNASVIQAVVQDAIRRVTDRGSVRVIVSPDDLKGIQCSREDILQVIDGIKNLVIDGDRRVGRGGCMIETTAGSIDSKIETQLEQVERAMRS